MSAQLNTNRIYSSISKNAVTRDATWVPRKFDSYAGGGRVYILYALKYPLYNLEINSARFVFGFPVHEE